MDCDRLSTRKKIYLQLVIKNLVAIYSIYCNDVVV